MVRNRLRWIPALMMPVVIAAGVVAANASGGTELPERSASEVFVMAAGHQDASFSGTVEQEAALGLPVLPGDVAGAVPKAADALEWLSGSHSVRVFVDGPERARIQVLDRLAERDVVINGRDVWAYDSREKTADHVVLPSRTCDHDVGGMRFQPTWLAQQLLRKLDASTEVTLGSHVKVAGRAAYDLVLTPTTQETLVGSVHVAVDGETGMPLSVRVFARGRDEPAISVGFTELSLETPEAALFEFAPPPGTAVTEHPALGDRPEKSDLPHHGDDPDPGEPIVSGSDWTTVVELPAGSVPAELFESPLYAQLTTAVSGGRLISTSLLNVLVTDDGRVIAGAVPVHLLQAAVTDQ